MVDKPWVELRAIVQAAFDDRAPHENPPRTPEEWGFFADSVTDCVYAYVIEARRQRG